MDRRIELLGGFALLAGGAPARLSARKARAVLGLLAAARHRTMPRARMAALLWEASDAESARVSLRQALSQIRRAAGEGWIVTDGDDLKLGPSVSTDLAEMSDALARSDDAAAAALYRGPFLDGLTLGVSAGDEAIATERARLAEMAARAMRREIVRLSGRAEAARMAHRLLGLDPLDEGAHRCLMAWDARSGARGAASARFETLRVALRRELDAAPEPETVALHDRIRRGALGGVRAPAEPTDAGPAEVSGDGFVALAMEGEAPLDPDGLHRVARDTGGRPAECGPGEALAVWGAGDLHAVAEGLLGLARRSGVSVGLQETDRPDTRTIARARRIAARGGPGEVFVSPALAARLGLPAEGAPVALRPAPARPTPPLVGREAELAQIDGAMAETAASGTGMVLHLCGEAGIGKTRLADEVAARAEARGARIVRAGFAPFAVQARPIAQALMAALPPDAGPAPSDPYAAAVAAWLRGETLPPEAELRLSAMSDDARRMRLRTVLAEALTRAADPAGLLVVVEDCHWAPDAADDLLLDLAARLAGAPVALVLTSRPDAASGLDHRLASQARTRLVRITLAPLPAPVAARLAAQVAPGAPGLQAAVDRARGHPLFLMRLLEAGWTEGELPDSVTALVQAQIERLPAAEREALRRASILGAAFAPEELAAVFPEAAPLRPHGDLLHVAGPRLAFGHDLIRQAVHDTLPPEIRRDWHARAALHHAGTDPVRWAEHALLAGDAADAARASLAAANEMISAMRLSAAANYVDAGLAHAAAADGDTLAELHSSRAGIRRMRGGLRAALDDYRAAHAAAVSDETRVAMLTRQALMLHRLDRGAEADRVLEAAETLADAIGLAGLARAEIHEQRGNRAFVTGDYAECLRQHGMGLAVAEATRDPRGMARAHGGLGDAHFAAGRMRTAFEHFDRAVTSAREAGLGMVDQEFGFMRSYALFFTEPGPRAHVLADLAVEAARGAGAARAEMIARETRAEMRLAALDLPGAREDADRLAQLLEADPESRFADDLMVLRAWIDLREGRPADAYARLEPHLVAAQSKSYNGAVILSLAALAAPTEATRDAVLRIGAERIEAGALSCAALWLHAFTLERLVRDGLPERARAQLEALRSFGGDERLGFVTHLVRAVETRLDGGDAAAREAVEADLAAARLEGFAMMMRS